MVVKQNLFFLSDLASLNVDRNDKPSNYDQHRLAINESHDWLKSKRLDYSKYLSELFNDGIFFDGI